jgi:hypothetical protein
MYLDVPRKGWWCSKFRVLKYGQEGVRGKSYAGVELVSGETRLPIVCVTYLPPQMILLSYDPVWKVLMRR